MLGLMTRSVRTSEEVIDLPDSLLRIVADVISVAWRHLLKEYDQATLCGFTEDEVTERLYMILGEIDSDPMPELRDLAQLQSPVREGNIRNYNNLHPDKQPDLAWRPIKGLLGKVGNTVTAAVFVECKPIDQARPVGSNYCKKGLIRFVNGDYSWRVNRAMMVGYVRNRSTLPGVLQRSLSNEEMKTLMGCSGLLKAKNKTIMNDAVWSTSHTRSFTINNKLMPNIQVDHLWLYTNSPCEQTVGRGSEVSGERQS